MSWLVWCWYGGVDRVKVDIMDVGVVKVDDEEVDMVVIDAVEDVVIEVDMLVVVVVEDDVVVVDVRVVVDEDNLMNDLICFGTYHQLDLNHRS